MIRGLGGTAPSVLVKYLCIKAGFLIPADKDSSPMISKYENN